MSTTSIEQYFSSSSMKLRDRQQEQKEQQNNRGKVKEDYQRKAQRKHVVESFGKLGEIYVMVPW